MKTAALGLFAVLLATRAPAATSGPDVTKILHVIGATSIAHACPIAPDRAITAAHVVQERPDSDAVPLRWGQTNTETNTVLVPLRANPRDDIVLLEVRPQTRAYYRLAPEAPKVGERLWWVAYDWRKKDDAFAERVLDGHVLRIVAGHLIMDVTTYPGSSGSCVLNDRGEVVALADFGRELEDGNTAAGLVGVWGDWLKDLLAGARP